MRSHPLSNRVPLGLPAILLAAEHGDWRLRAACLSEAGRIARRESFIVRTLARVIRRLPGLGSHVHPAGPGGLYVRGPIANGLVDRSWPVRVAAALGLGECRSSTQIASLEQALVGPFRAERIAAASAILACGGTVTTDGASLLRDALPVPEFIGDTSSSFEVLSALASAHSEVLARWRTLPGVEQPAGSDAKAWADFLRGSRGTETVSSLQAEMDRYDPEGETEYLLSKPFSPINRLENPRLLHTFAAVCDQLNVPAQARVLDLGGGSAWVSELLSRLGYAPVTLDASAGLLAIGKRRFARGGLTPQFVCGDMASLPIASTSMKAAIVIDALHHVPNVEAVFREVFRVLEDGGVFVLAEPGEGHSETKRARSEVVEFGVHEREIHVLEAFDYAERAGFDDVRVVPNPAPAISMTRSQMVDAMSSPSGRWMVLNNEHPGYLAPYVIQSVFCHPILVCRKGRQVIDSRGPNALLAEILPRLRRDGQHVAGSVMVRNVGDTVWLAGRERGHVQVGIQLMDANRNLILLDFERAALTHDVAPRDSLEVAIACSLPDPSTPFILKIDMVDEGICWFQGVGSQPAYVAV